MEKNIGFSAQPSAPLPTAPPSYEEAIANTGRTPLHPPGSSPYPLGTAPISMPMPCMCVICFKNRKLFLRIGDIYFFKLENILFLVIKKSACIE